MAIQRWEVLRFYIFPLSEHKQQFLIFWIKYHSFKSVISEPITMKYKINWCYERKGDPQEKSINFSNLEALKTPYLLICILLKYQKVTPQVSRAFLFFLQFWPFHWISSVTSTDVLFDDSFRAEGNHKKRDGTSLMMAQEEIPTNNPPFLIVWRFY